MPEIRYRKTKDLDALHHNPRFIRDGDFQSLCKSLRDNPEYFEARPLILSNRTGILVIVAGNMRFRAALENGLTQVPTILLEGLTEEKEREIIIRDNVNNGNWDYDILANEWDLRSICEWGVPPVWDSPGEAETPGEENESGSESLGLPVPSLTIEFDDYDEMMKARTEIEEVLRSYQGAKIKA